MVPFKAVLAELGDDHANKAQRIWESLLIATVQRHGGDVATIQTTAEVRSKDGGVDIFVQHPGTPDALRLLRNGPTIYSVKSGEYAGKVGTLYVELGQREEPRRRPKAKNAKPSSAKKKPKHGTLVQRIKNGEHYVYCVFADATQDAQAKLKSAAEELCKKFGVPSGRISVAFHTGIERGLWAYPGVLQNHFPDLAQKLGRPGQAWGRTPLIFNKDVEFAALTARSEIFNRLVSHVNSREGDPLLHLCGLSGIGKTRMVYEAVKQCGVLESVLYRANPGGAEDLLQFFIQNETACGVVVIDECSLSVRDEFRTLLADATKKDKTVPQRVRIITIGPLMRSESVYSPDIQLPEPESEEEVLQVLRKGTEGQLNEADLRELALDARHDIRLGLLFLKVRREGGPGSRGGREIKQLLDRVIGLFEPEKHGATEFRKHFAYLSVLLTLGVSGAYRDELQWLAREFELDLTRLDETREVAMNCGLGERGIDLFEVVPRGLATRLFEEHCWPVIRNRLPLFLDRLPTPAARNAFLDRLDLCGPAVRNAAAPIVTEYCRRVLPEPDPRRLMEPFMPALVVRWLRLSPEPALRWLEHAVVPHSGTTPEVAEQMKRACGANLQRDRIWATVRVLAAFPEYFERAERLLFSMTCGDPRSPGHEHEETWPSLFGNYHSFTAVAFSTRLNVLVARLRRSAGDDLDVLIQGVRFALGFHSFMREPTGRAGSIRAPKESPTTVQECNARHAMLVRSLIAALPSMHAAVSNRIHRFLGEQLSSIVKAGLVADLRAALPTPDIDPKLARKVRLGLLRRLHRSDVRPSEGADKFFQELQAWADFMRPATLSEQLRECLYGDDMEAVLLLGIRDTEGIKQLHVFDGIAPKIIEDPSVFEDLQSTLADRSETLTISLGSALGRLDTANTLEASIKRMLAHHHCQSFLIGYLQARTRRDGQLPPWAVASLDDGVTRCPQWSAELTALVDVSERGLERVLECVKRPGGRIADVLGQMVIEWWSPFLDASRVDRLIELVLDQPATSLEERCAAAMRFLHRRYDEIPTEPYADPVHERAKALLSTAIPLGGSVSLNQWTQVVTRVGMRDPVAMIQVVMAQLFAAKPLDTDVVDQCLSLLQGFDAAHSAEVARAFLTRLGVDDPPLTPLAYLLPRFIERFPPDEIARAIARHNRRYLLEISSLIPHPRLNFDDGPHIPAVTRWFLDAHGVDEGCFSYFLHGQDGPSGRITTFEQMRQEIASLQAAFNTNDDPLIQRWLSAIDQDQTAREQSWRDRTRELPRD